MNQGRMMQGPEYAFHAVLDRQDETGGQLSQSAPGIHQSGGIGQKLTFGHQLIEGILPPFDLFGGWVAIFFLRLGNVPRHPPKHLLGSFDYLALVVFFQITSF